MIPDCGVLTAPRSVPPVKLTAEGLLATSPQTDLSLSLPTSTGFIFSASPRSSEISGVNLSSGFSFGFYESPKNILSPPKVDHHPTSYSKKRQRDDINKGVGGHKIKKIKLKAKAKKGRTSVKTVVKRLKEGIYAPCLPSNRSPLKTPTSRERRKSHVLSSPGISLLDSQEPDENFLTESRNGKFFTSRSRAAATVQIGKSIKLVARNGDVCLKQRGRIFEKKNIGRRLEAELNLYLDQSVKSQSVNQVLSLPSVQANPRPLPSRVPSTPSPVKQSAQRRKSRTPSPRKFNKINTSESAMNVSTASNGEELQDLEFALKEMDAELDKLTAANKALPADEDVLPLKSPRKADSSSSPNKSRKKLEQTKSPTRKSPRKRKDEAVLPKELQKDEELLTKCSLTQSQEQTHSPRRKSPRKAEKGLQKNECASSSPQKSLSLKNKDKDTKLYSIFDPKRRLADQNIPFKKSQNKLSRQKAADKEDSQMMIDAGQKKFGAQQCSVCGVVYEVGNQADEISHNRHHDHFVNSLKFLGWKKEKLVRDMDHLGGRVVMVSSDDPPHYWRKVEDICEIIDAELGFSENSIKAKETTKVFLYILERRIVGCLVAEKIDKAYKIIHQASTRDTARPVCCSETPSRVWAGVSRLWVFKSQRGKGIASTLVNSMRDNMIANYFLNVNEIAFSDPTENGLKFAEKYTGKPDFLVYRREGL